MDSRTCLSTHTVTAFASLINCVGSASSDCGPNLVLLVASTRRHVFCSSCDAPGLAERENLKLSSLAYSSTRVGLALSFPTSLSQTQICAPGFPLALLEGAKTTEPINPQTCTKTLRQESGNKNMCSAIYTQNATAFVCPAAYFLISLSGSFIRLWFNRTTPNACPKAQTDLLVVIFFQVCITKI